MELIGNSPSESAFHEAGHIVIAAAVGLDLRPAGIILFETGTVAGGIACYWEDAELEPVLRALRAGQQAQLRMYPGSEIRGGQGDVKTFFDALKQTGIDNRGEMWERISSEVEALLSQFWGAVVEVADTLLRRDSIPIDAADSKYLAPEELALARSKKQLLGDEIVAILLQRGLPARVRTSGN